MAAHPRRAGRRAGPDGRARRRRADPHRRRALPHPRVPHRRARDPAAPPAVARAGAAVDRPPRPGARPRSGRVARIGGRGDAFDVESRPTPSAAASHRRAAPSSAPDPRGAAASVRRPASSSGATGASTRRIRCSGRSRPVGPAMRSATCTSSASRPWSSSGSRRSPHRVVEPRREHAAHAGHEPHERGRAHELFEQRAGAERHQHLVGARPDHLDAARATARTRWPRRRRRAGRCASLRASRRRQRSSPAPRTASTSRSGRDSSASPASSGHPITAIGRSCGKGSSPARRPGVWSSRTSPSASHAASEGSGAASTRAHSHQSRGESVWWSTSRRHATTRPAGSSSNAARQSAASATRVRSSPAWRAM